MASLPPVSTGASVSESHCALLSKVRTPRRQRKARDFLLASASFSLGLLAILGRPRRSIDAMGQCKEGRSVSDSSVSVAKLVDFSQTRGLGISRLVSVGERKLSPQPFEQARLRKPFSTLFPIGYTCHWVFNSPNSASYHSSAHMGLCSVGVCQVKNVMYTVPTYIQRDS